MKSGKITIGVLLLVLAGSWTWYLTSTATSRLLESTSANAAVEKRAAAPVFAGVHSLSEILAEKDQLQALAWYARHVLQLKADEFKSELTRVMAIVRPRQHDTFLELLLKRWGEVDPHAALDAFAVVQSQPIEKVGRLMNPPMEGDMYAGMRVDAVEGNRNAILAGWAIEQPRAAWDWINHSTADLDWAVSEEVHSPRPLEGLAAGRQENQRRDVIHGLLGSGRFSTAAELLTNPPAEALDLIPELIESWALYEQSAAGTWLMNSVAPGQTRSQAIRIFIRTVGNDANQPEIAAKFFAGLTDPADIDAAASGMVYTIYGHGGWRAVYRWLTVTAGDNRSGAYDKAIGVFFAMPVPADAAPADDEAERTLLAKIQDPTVRTQAAAHYANPVSEQTAAAEMIVR